MKTMCCDSCGQSVYSGGDITRISCAIDIYNLYRLQYARTHTETFSAIFLDTRNNILDKQDIAKGTINCVHVSPADVLKPALTLNAVSFICLHNHPSGDSAPSTEDKTLTRRMIDAGQLLGIKMLDHVIVCHDNFYSFCDAGEIF